MDVKLTPRDRAVQLGKEAHLVLLNGLLLQTLEQPGDAGCGGGAPGHSRKALIVQLEPGEFGELGHAALDKLLEVEAAGGPECPPDCIHGHLCWLRQNPPRGSAGKDCVPG